MQSVGMNVATVPDRLHERGYMKQHVIRKAPIQTFIGER